MFDIGVYAYLRALFFANSEEFGQVSVDSERAFSDRLLAQVNLKKARVSTLRQITFL